MEIYEFNQLQNKEFLNLASKIKLALGAFLLLALMDFWALLTSFKDFTLLHDSMSIIIVLALSYTVAALWRARARLIKIAKTEGEDLSLLFKGTRCLGGAFTSVAIAVLAEIAQHIEHFYH